MRCKWHHQVLQCASTAICICHPKFTHTNAYVHKYSYVHTYVIVIGINYIYMLIIYMNMCIFKYNIYWFMNVRAYIYICIGYYKFYIFNNVLVWYECGVQSNVYQFTNQLPQRKSWIKVRSARRHPETSPEASWWRRPSKKRQKTWKVIGFIQL